MTKFNPDFWETTLEPDGWERLSTEDGLWSQGRDESPASGHLAARARALWSDVQPIMAEVLTVRQHEVVRLYFLQALNQRQIGQRLGISQQAVSEHLYGKVRNGRAVGGALRKLRKACIRRGVRWE